MRNMRRKGREMTTEEAIRILKTTEYGVLSTVGIDGQPYGVPLSFVYMDNCIYFHCALSGQKLDNIQHNARVSFCVVGNTTVLPETFGTEYESTVVFGRASELKGAERNTALLLLLEKYCADFIEEGKYYMEQQTKAVKVFQIEINHISGKARR